MSDHVRRWCLLAMLAIAAPSAHARVWGDAADRLAIEAELFAFDDQYVVLQRADRELALLPMNDLSASDREYLKSKEAAAVNDKNIYAVQTWTTTNGLKLTGRIVDFQQGSLTIQRRRDQTYVNDRRLTNLPETYRALLPLIIQHFEDVEISNERAMQNWLRSLRNRPRTFHIDGVVLEVENGDEYAIPFFVFADADRKLLKAGWSNWLDVQDDFERRHAHAFRLEALAAAHFQNQEYKREIALMNLNLQAIRAGLTAAWEVTLYPEPGNPSPPLWVVMLGRNSAQATDAALAENPGFVAGPVRRVSR